MLLWIILLLPASTAGLLLLGGRRLDGLAGVAGIAQAAGGCALSAWAWAARPASAVGWLALPSRQVELSLSAAGAAGALGFVVATVVLAVTVYAHGFLDRDEARARFFGFFALFAAGMQAIVLAGDLLLLLFAWEVVGACSFALIAFWHHNPERVTAARRAFVVTRSADLGLYLAAMAALGIGGTMSVPALAGLDTGWRAVVAAGLIAAAAGKSAQLPFSGWLRGAMEGPTPVSALLHSATMVAAGVVLLAKTAPLLAAVPWAGPLVISIGIATALAGALVACAETDIKRALAASTVSQHGYMFAAAGAGGTAAAVTYMANHAAFKALLFMTAGILVARHLKSLPAGPRLRRALPRTAALFAVGALGLAALPPAGGFLAKEAVLAAVKEASTVGWAVLLAVSALTSGYAARLYLLAFEAPVRGDPPVRREDRPAVLLPAAALAVAVLLLALPLLPPLEQPWTAVLAVGALPPMHPGSLMLSLAVVLSGVAGATWLWRRGQLLAPLPGAAAARGWFGLETGLDAVGRAILMAGRSCDRLDRIAGLERVSGGVGRLAAVLATARPAAWLETASVRSVRLLAAGTVASDRSLWDGAVHRLDRGAHRAASMLSRLQSGMLHQYYAQVALGAAVLVVAGGLMFRE